MPSQSTLSTGTTPQTTLISYFSCFVTAYNPDPACPRSDAPQARQHMRICAEGQLRAKSLTQWSTGPTGWWHGNVRGSATSATQPIQHPTHSDRSRPPTARIGPKLGRNIEHWWYDGSPANRSAAIPRSPAISQDIY